MAPPILRGMLPNMPTLIRKWDLLSFSLKKAAKSHPWFPLRNKKPNLQWKIFKLKENAFQHSRLENGDYMLIVIHIYMAFCHLQRQVPFLKRLLRVELAAKL